MIAEGDVPISRDWQNRVDEIIRPYGKLRWYDAVMAKARPVLNCNSKATVLEAGCGRNCWITGKLREEGFDMRVVGVDIDPACLENEDVDVAQVASLDRIPLDSESVDLVMSGWVFEHLSDPVVVLKEIHRVLKPGGILIFWTPNLYNPTMLISSATPCAFHVWWRRLNAGAEHADNVPTYYRINTLAKIRSLARKSGLVYEYGDTFSTAHAYFRMAKATYLIGCILSKLTVIWPLSRLRLTLVSVLRKPS